MKNPVYKFTRAQIINDYVKKQKEMGNEIPRDTVKTRLKNFNKFLDIDNINSVGQRYAELNCDNDGFAQLDVMNDDKYYSEDDKAIMFAWLDEFNYGFISLFPMNSGKNGIGFYTVPLNKQTKEYSDEYKAEYLAFQNRMNKLIKSLSDDYKKYQIISLCDSFSVFDTSLIEKYLPTFVLQFEELLKKVDFSKILALRERAESDWLLWLDRIKDEFLIETQNGREVFPYAKKENNTLQEIIKKEIFNKYIYKAESNRIKNQHHYTMAIS